VIPPVESEKPPAGATGMTLTVPDAALVPAALLAVTTHEYVVPLARPETVTGLALPTFDRDVVPAVQVTV
jgi:hypothetical protein